MSLPEEVHYTVVLVFPDFGDEREYAEQVVEAALEHLNIPNYEPGMRFAPHVRAHLEIVTHIEQAQDKLESDDSLAMMILHDLDDDEKMHLTEECAAKGVLVCHTMESSGRPRKKRRIREGESPGFTFTLSKRDDNRPRAHQIPATTLTDPPEEAEWGDRVGQLIMVLALGVMEHHWSKQPRRFPPIQ